MSAGTSTVVVFPLTFKVKGIALTLRKKGRSTDRATTVLDGDCRAKSKRRICRYFSAMMQRTIAHDAAGRSSRPLRSLVQQTAAQAPPARPNAAPQPRLRPGSAVRRLAGGLRRRGARTRGFSDDAAAADARRPRAAAARHPERPHPGRAHPGLQPLLLEPGSRRPMVRRGRDAGRASTARCSAASRATYERAAPLHRGDLGHGKPLRPADRPRRRSSGRSPRWPGSRGARDFFRGELFDALTMVDRGHIDARRP